ncbi:hypothetical protein, partial [Streptomyces sp. NPDC046161]|uniref:hypothetical protein n=1 Tax=Streptomyces sp. NPDC046161 TaxID=3155132 RepID=UPI0033F22C1C
MSAPSAPYFAKDLRMVTSTEPVTPIPVPGRSLGQVVVAWLSTTDHKKIGHLYLIASFVFFVIG